VAVFLGLILMRSLSSQRRHRDRPGRSPAASSFSGPTGASPAASTVDAPAGEVTFTGIAPGWLTDPTGRHEKRYWSGSEWTEHVTDGGIPGTDPPPPRDTGRAAS
jgi:hypothetical protein